MTIVYLTAGQAAAQLGLHPASIARYCASGRLRAERFGRSAWRISQAALDEFAHIPRKPGHRSKKEEETTP